MLKAIYFAFFVSENPTLQDPLILLENFMFIQIPRSRSR